MHSLSSKSTQNHYSMLPTAREDYWSAPMPSCSWQSLRQQLLAQWERLEPQDLDRAGPNRRRIALLIQYKYGIASELVENYLRNFERTMPLPLVTQ